MPDQDRDRVAVTGRLARTVEPPRERPQWQGLFVEPDLPPVEEADDV
jgi:hypothetical protein